MARPFLTPIDLNGLELLNARIQNLPAAPASPTEGRIYFDTTAHNARIYSNGTWVDIVTGSAGYTDEQAQDAIAALIAAGTQSGLTVTYNDAANSMSFTVAADAAAATPSLRTLGTGAAQAASGADARLSDTRTPTDGTVTTAKIASGGLAPAAVTGTAVVTADARLSDARTPTAGSVIDASITAGGLSPAKIAGTAVVTADARLSDTRTPTAGSVVDASIVTGGLSPAKITGTAVVTADARLSDTRTPTAGSVVDASITAGGLSPAKITGTAVVTADTRLSDARNPIAGSVTNASVAAGAAISSDKLADGTTNGVYTLAERTKLAGIATGANLYNDTNARLNRLDQFAQPTVALNMGGQRITNSADPTSNTDLVTKQYADGLRQGISIKDPVAVATTANITLSALQAIDGYTTLAGDRVLVKNQTTGSQNGIYVAAAGAWVRAVDADVSAELPEGAAVWIQGGTTQGNTRWVNTTTGGITLGTTTLTFTQDFAATSVTAGNGLTAAGNAFNVGGGTGITVAADSISIDTAVVTRKANFSVGDGAATAYNLAHNFGTRDVQVRVYRNSTPWDDVELDVSRPDVNTVTVAFATAPAAGAFRAVVQG